MDGGRNSPDGSANLWRNLMLTVTEDCNLSCRYCYEKKHDYAPDRNMSWELARGSGLLRRVVGYSYPHRTTGGNKAPRPNYIVNTNDTILDDETYELYKGLRRGQDRNQRGPGQALYRQAGLASCHRQSAALPDIAGKLRRQQGITCTVN